MDSRTPPPQTTRPPNHPTLPGSDPNPRDCPAAQARKVIALLQIFLKTLRHFFPESPAWLDQLPDTRFQPMVTYHRRFLCWWGLLLFGLGLGSRRSADNDLRDLEHVFSQNWEHAKAYYYLLQLGHLLMQLLHHNSLHRALAKEYGPPSVLALWGALKKIPQRLLEALRYYLLPEANFDVRAAARCHIALNTS